MTNNDELRRHVRELLNAVYGYLSMDDVLQQRAAHVRNTTFDPADVSRRARQYGPIADEATADWYEPLCEHAAAVLTLTDDRSLRIVVRKLKHLADADVEERRNTLAKGSEVAAPVDSLKFLGSATTTAFGMLARRKQIKAALSELQTWQTNHAA